MPRLIGHAEPEASNRCALTALDRAARLVADYIEQAQETERVQLLDVLPDLREARYQFANATITEAEFLERVEGIAERRRRNGLCPRCGQPSQGTCDNCGAPAHP